MYLITVEGVTDESILKNIYTNIDCFGLASKIFLIYRLNLEESNKINKNIFAHIYILGLEQLNNLSETEIEDVILDLIELNANLLIDCTGCEDEEKVDTFFAIAKDFGLKYGIFEPFDFKRKIDFKDLSYNDYQIILELFNEKTSHMVFKSSKFLFRYRVDKNGKIYDKNRLVTDLNKEQFINMTFYRPKNIDTLINETLEYYDDKQILSLNFYEPFAFLFEDRNINKKIIEYKYRVFDAIKNISPEDYPLLPKELAEILNMNGYVQFNDILQIISA